MDRYSDFKWCPVHSTTTTKATKNNKDGRVTLVMQPLQLHVVGAAIIVCWLLLMMMPPVIITSSRVLWWSAVILEEQRVVPATQSQ